MKKISWLLCMWMIGVVTVACSKSQKSGGDNPPPPVDPPVTEDVVYDETGCLYKSYKNLVMAGYQGWFAAQGDASERGWYHYQNGSCGGFMPGCSAMMKERD